MFQIQKTVTGCLQNTMPAQLGLPLAGFFAELKSHLFGGIVISLYIEVISIFYEIQRPCI
jgi:hypothetical protein